MKKVDYIVVGLGLAGIAFCEYLRQNKHSFIVFDTQTGNASKVAGAVYNPVVLKRFTLAWQGDKQLKLAVPFYTRLAEKLAVPLLQPKTVYRRFTSVEEQNNWFEAADSPRLTPFLTTKVQPNTNAALNAPFGFGEVQHTGRMDTIVLLKSYAVFLQKHEQLQQEAFAYEALHHTSDGHFSYKDIEASKVIFAEGYGLKENPFFSWLPLVGNKGELLTISAPLLQIKHIIKASVFIIPLEGDLYRVGATYNPTDKTTVPTASGKEQLLKQLDKLLHCPYEVVDHTAGIRPTVKDRRPLLGEHPKIKNMFVLNGLGTRGVLLAPFVAKALYESIEKQQPLEDEMAISRFYSHF